VGQFVGKIAFEADEIAPVTVVAMEPVRQVSWNKQDLRNFLKNKTELLSALQLILGVDLTVRLETAYKHAAANHSKS
jgi:CRP-like cAMP-binding protein